MPILPAVTYVPCTPSASHNLKIPPPTLGPNTHLAACLRQVADTLPVQAHVYTSALIPIGNLSCLGSEMALAQVPVSSWWLHNSVRGP